MESRTRIGADFGARDVIVRWADGRVLDIDIQWFLQMLEEMIRTGSRFEPGHTFQLGWSVLRFAAEGDLVAMEELDFSGEPGRFCPGVTRSLSSLRLQRSVNESLGLEGQLAFPSMRHSALVCCELGAEGPVVGERREGAGPKSGWFFRCAEEGHDHDAADARVEVNLYQVATRVPAVIPVLALPPVHHTVIHPDGRITVSDAAGRPLPVRPGSYLALRQEKLRPS